MEPTTIPDDPAQSMPPHEDSTQNAPSADVSSELPSNELESSTIPDDSTQIIPAPDGSTQNAPSADASGSSEVVQSSSQETAAPPSQLFEAVVSPFPNPEGQEDSANPIDFPGNPEAYEAADGEGNESDSEDEKHVPEEEVAKKQDICYNCGARGHIKRECQEEPYCATCQTHGHWTKKCPSTTLGKVCKTCFQPESETHQCVGLANSVNRVLPLLKPDVVGINDGITSGECEILITFSATKAEAYHWMVRWLFLAQQHKLSTKKLADVLNGNPRCPWTLVAVKPELTVSTYILSLNQEAATYAIDIAKKLQTPEDPNNVYLVSRDRSSLYLADFTENDRRIREEKLGLLVGNGRVPCYFCGRGKCEDIACGNDRLQHHRIRANPAEFKSDFTCPACGNAGHDLNSCDSARAKEWGEWDCAECMTNYHAWEKCPRKWSHLSHKTGRKHCFNCGSLNHKSEDCDKDKKELCMKCGDEGHDFKSCSIGLTCFKCKEEGHRGTECPNPPCRDCGEPEHDDPADCTLSKVTCNFCNETGHRRRDCPRKPKEVCFLCQSEDHKKADCPNKAQHQCRNCGQMGHTPEECARPPPPNVCYNCGDAGHPAHLCAAAPSRCFFCDTDLHNFASCEHRDRLLPTCGHCRLKGHTAQRCPNKACANCGDPRNHEGGRCTFRILCPTCGSNKGHKPGCTAAPRPRRQQAQMPVRSFGSTGLDPALNSNAGFAPAPGPW